MIETAASPESGLNPASLPALESATRRQDGQQRSAAASLRIDLLLVTACTLFAVALRYGFALRSGMWRDEALFLYVVRFPTVGSLLQFLHFHESHPPLFYFLMRGWLKLTGNSDTAALSLPVLLGSAIVPLLYSIGNRVWNRSVGLLAGLFAALSASLADNAGMVRPYSLLPLLCLLSVYLLWRAAFDRENTHRTRSWVGYTVATLALLYTHNWTCLIVTAEWILVGAVWTLPVLRPYLAEDRKQVAKSWLLAQALVIAGYSPWVPSLLYQVKHAGHGVAGQPNPFPTLAQFSTIVLPLPDNDSIIAFLLLASVLGAAWYLRRRSAGSAVAAVGGAAPKELPKVARLLLFAGVPLIALGIALVLNTKSLLIIPRCLAMLTPCLLLPVCAAILALPGRAVVRLVTVATLIIGCGYTSSILLAQPRSNARELAALISAAARPDDLIVITPEQLASSFNYYYKKDTAQIDFPGYGKQTYTTFDDWAARTGERPRFDHVRRKIAEAHEGHHRVWLIVQNGSFFDNLPDDDKKLPTKWFHSGIIGFVRSSQILQWTKRVYGNPAQVVIPNNVTVGDEIEVALLFDRDAVPLQSAPRTAATPD